MMAWLTCVCACVHVPTVAAVAPKQQQQQQQQDSGGGGGRLPLIGSRHERREGLRIKQHKRRFWSIDPSITFHDLNVAVGGYSVGTAWVAVTSADDGPCLLVLLLLACVCWLLGPTHERQRVTFRGTTAGKLKQKQEKKCMKEKKRKKKEQKAHGL